MTFAADAIQHFGITVPEPDAPIEQRVAAGAAFLDAVAPGWQTRVDTSTLDFDSDERCVIAQVFDSTYTSVAIDFGLFSVGVELGFDALSEDEHDLPELADAWEDVITRWHGDRMAEPVEHDPTLHFSLPA